MPRKLRLEFPGACYHVINRGNYRTDVFKATATKAAFEDCLFEAGAKSGWRLHAFVIMRNHFHLAVETPDGNLVSGMHWLQCTFATRFNRLRNERGHLFQGRYKAILVEEGEPFGLVSAYVHLNPVRAHLLSVARLEEYRYSSYWYLRQPRKRPPCLRLDLMLAATGQLADNPAGWDSYRDYLVWQAEEGPAGNSAAYVSLSKGWALGSTGFKAALIADHAVAATARAWERKGAEEVRALAWEMACRRALEAMRRTDADLASAARSARWKVALAIFLKERTQASNRWLGRRLNLGSAKYVSHLVSVMKRRTVPAPELTHLRASSDLRLP
ncbi:MAG TPA: transposase [Lacunisphaera sp.]|nr:transposase [Lacunisphaera sp.]